MSISVSVSGNTVSATVQGGGVSAGVSSLNGLSGSVSIAAGDGVNVTASGATITLSAAGGTSGVTVGSATPLDLGVATAGTSGNAAREDHVHNLPTIAYTALSGVPTTFAPATHTHTIAEVDGLQSELDGKAAATATNVSRVVSLNGLTGTLSIASGDNVTVSTAAGSITIAAAAGGGGGGGDVASVNNQTGTVTIVSVDVSAASAVHAVQHMAGGSDLVLPVVGSTAVSAILDDFSAPTADIVRLANSSSSTAVITGLSGGVGGYVRLLVNTSTNGVRIAHQSTGSDATNRFLISGGYDLDLDENRSVPAWYDADTERWRVSSAGFGTAATVAQSVYSVNGLVGTVVLDHTSVSAASASHSHVSSDITDLTSVANIVSINGITGTVTISAGSNVTVATASGSITITAASPAAASVEASRAVLFLLR